MLGRLIRGLAGCYRRCEVVAVRWRTAKPLRRRLSRTSDPTLDGALDAAGLRRGDLFTAFKGNARHRKRMAAMMARFHVDRGLAAEAFWPQLREADARCAECSQTGRCERLLRWGLRADTARRFCPNAALFEQIALAERSRQPAP